MGLGKAYQTLVSTSETHRALFTSIFFVLVGLSLDLRAIYWSSSFIWLYSRSLPVAAVAGKLFGAMLLKENWPVCWIIATAMILCGEVGLIFAEPGHESWIFSSEVYACMVIVFTLDGACEV